MKIFVSVIMFLSCISGIGAFVFFVRTIIFKIIYYPSSRREEISEKIAINSKIFSFLIFFCIFSVWGTKSLIAFQLKEKLSENTIVSAEFDGIFFSKDDVKGMFDHIESDEGRNRCDSFSGFLNLENGEEIPIEVIRHCYEKNRYIIISKQYDFDATIGDIITDKFDYIKSDSVYAE